ncbi:hypothetical protein LEP1GSC173_2681 [Leptospira interrogans str. HAI1594]|uniref:Uncharacterized protein n=4 Tax=Leptospira interrogans TaxID=173 RepID=A0AAP9WE20_LEPIR|nr:conserved hypothetical protein [Leptospira interrogans serovar Copenhageni str. Fiocruz L1-130]ALE40583.1 hypothetical protein G436_3431 [Leptospira interrogans serovar Hardjo str. Norma]ARB96916.1 hypothetical protein A6J42_16760 [Leptospira interrogans serovar Copenhageni]ASV05549.1 hypothetical protein B2G47_05125 [Leptospira interrogans serovar Canicola]EKP75420.1 hypothetical protein LEP1GSC173_2681 [Leptospira interrogans str. HAI1594]KWV22945.1 hypothetical protein LA733_2940 [Leptos
MNSPSCFCFMKWSVEVILLITAMEFFNNSNIKKSIYDYNRKKVYADFIIFFINRFFTSNHVR